MWSVLGPRYVEAAESAPDWQAGRRYRSCQADEVTARPRCRAKNRTALSASWSRLAIRPGLGSPFKAGKVICGL